MRRLCGEKEGKCNIHIKQGIKIKLLLLDVVKYLNQEKEKEKCGMPVYKNKPCKKIMQATL